MEIRALIADDDEGMRLVLKKALQRQGLLTVTKEVASGQEAIGGIEEGNIHIAFLDVDMPGMSGIEAAKQILDIHPKCIIVFVTAHETYMQDAFQLYAFDYIIKPFKVERLYKTVERIVEYIHEMTSTAPLEDKKKRLLLKIKEGMVMIKPEDIILVERVHRSTVVITENEEYVTQLNLADLEKVLPVGEFMRSHKSYIISIDKIRKIEIYGRWTYVIKFRGTDKDALMTKEKFKELELIMKK